MKKIFIISIIALSFLACSGNKGFKHGEKVFISERCIAASDEENYKLMSKYCARKDETGLEIMETLGQITILEQGTQGVVTDMSLGIVKIRLDDKREFWCANEFVK